MRCSLPNHLNKKQGDLNMKQKNTIKKVIRLSCVASLYVALTLALSWISYGSIQFRVAEVLVLLCFFRKDYGFALILGCAIANGFSTLGMIDVVFGTLATLIAVIGVMYSKNLIVASIFPVISNAIIVGLELTYVFNTPLWFNMFSVGVGELVFMAVGVSIFMMINKNSYLLEIIDANQNIN